jgi:hypothetical protein
VSLANIMMIRAGAGWADNARVARFLVAAVGMVAALGVGLLVAPHERIAVLLAALGLAAGIVTVDPLLLPVLAVAGTLLVQRVGGAPGSGVDLSDVLLGLASLIVAPFLPWTHARNLAVAVSWSVAYEAVLLISVVDHANVHSVTELGHRLFLVAGAMIVGWTAASNGRAPQAIRILFVGSGVLALLAIEHAVTLHFKPAQWGAYQKNYIGTMMWMTIVIAHLDPPWAAIPVRLGRAVKFLCLVGLFATQSKQAIIALVAAILVATFRQRSLRRRSKAILVALAPLAVFAYVVAAQEVAKYSRHGNNSLQERAVAYSAGFTVWHLGLWFGEGPRWWYLPRFAGNIQPPNIVLEALTESGIIGTVALFAMLIALIVFLGRLPRELATVGLVLVLGRTIEGIFDLYWASADGALPWLIVGLCLGATDAARSYTDRRAATVSRSGLLPVPV